MVKKIVGPKWRRREWVAFATIYIMGMIGMAVAAMAEPKGDITGTISKADPLTQQDGTAEHPYADASHCPSKVDIIFWSRNDQPIPIIPPSISVCFVGDRPLNSGDALEVRDR